MCDADRRNRLVQEVRSFLTNQGIGCETMGDKIRYGFWVTDARWDRPNARVGFVLACSDERPRVAREPHRLTPCFHVAPTSCLRLAFDEHQAVRVERQSSADPHAGYAHMWFVSRDTGNEEDLGAADFTEAFGHRVLDLLYLIQPM
jgi:hypothetical protein